MQIKIKKLADDAKLPSYAHSHDAGMDLYSCETFLLEPNERHAFDLGFAMEIPEGFVGLVWDKSGLSFKYGLHCLGGVIDSTYRGEVKIMIINLGEKPYQVEKGDKIAQLLIQPIVSAKIIETSKLDKTAREDGAFGSTGKK